MCVNNQSLVRELVHAIFIHLFSNALQLKEKMKYIHLLFSHQKGFLFDEKIKGIYISCIFPFATCIYIYIYHINYGVIQGFPALRKAACSILLINC